MAAGVGPLLDRLYLTNALVTPWTTTTSQGGQRVGRLDKVSGSRRCSSCPWHAGHHYGTEVGFWRARAGEPRDMRLRDELRQHIRGCSKEGEPATPGGALRPWRWRTTSWRCANLARAGRGGGRESRPRTRRLELPVALWAKPRRSRCELARSRRPRSGPGGEWLRRLAETAAVQWRAGALTREVTFEARGAPSDAVVNGSSLELGGWSPERGLGEGRPRARAFTRGRRVRVQARGSA